jgi:hypothetical protein
MIAFSASRTKMLQLASMVAKAAMSKKLIPTSSALRATATAWHSIVLALLQQSDRAFETEWKSLIALSAGLTPQKFADIFIETILRLVRQHPSYLALQAAPIRLRRDPASRRALRLAIADAFCAKNPALTKERAFLSANVVVQTVGGMTRLFAESDPQDRPTIVADYKGILTAYLTVILRG